MPTVRETLDSLEKDLETRIQKLRAELVPLEGELADVRRAKGALAKAEVKPEDIPTWARPEDPPLPRKEPVYALLTMKELTVKALREQFPNGATANQLLEHFYNAWSRFDVVRSSLSPQLSRLRVEKKIDLKPGNIWVLLPEKNEAPTEGQSGGASNKGEGGSSLLDSRAGRLLLLD